MWRILSHQPRTMRIALFDDHQMVLDALAAYLSAKPGVEIVGQSTAREAILRLLQTETVDILISDVITDEELGLELFEQVQALRVETRIVVYSSVSSAFVQDFLKAYGVVAFLNKRQHLDSLWETLQLVHQARYQKPVSEGPPPTLTDKEKLIARYLSKGLTAKEIATLTDSALNTINNQKKVLLEKFGCLNSVELTTKLMQMGYLKG